MNHVTGFSTVILNSPLYLNALRRRRSLKNDIENASQIKPSSDSQHPAFGVTKNSGQILGDLVAPILPTSEMVSPSVKLLLDNRLGELLRYATSITVLPYY